MSGIDPLSQPEDRIQAGHEEFSSLLPREGESLPILDEPVEPPPVRTDGQPFPLHPNFWWGLLWSLGIWLIMQIAGTIVSIILLVGAVILFPNRLNLEELANVKTMLQNPVVQLVFGGGQAAGLGVQLLGALILLRILAGRNWTRQVALRRPASIHFVLGILVLPAFVVLGNGAYHFIRTVLHVPSMSSWGLPGMEELGELTFSGWGIPAAVFVIGVMPGLSEELWCRAFLGRGLVGKHGVVLGVLGTSFLFGLIHVDPAQGMMAMLMGILLHFVYLTTRSLLMPMLLHFLNNSLSVVEGSLFPTLAKLDNHQGDLLIPLYTGASLLMIAVCWALYQSRARLVSEGESVWQPPYPGVVCPPPNSGTRIETPLPSATALAAVAAGLTAFVVGLVMSLQHIG